MLEVGQTQNLAVIAKAEDKYYFLIMILITMVNSLSQNFEYDVKLINNVGI